jgi:hypothetical protein
VAEKDWHEVSHITSNMRNKLCMFVVRLQFLASLLALPLELGNSSSLSSIFLQRSGSLGGREVGYLLAHRGAKSEAVS